MGCFSPLLCIRSDRHLLICKSVISVTLGLGLSACQVSDEQHDDDDKLTQSSGQRQCADWNLDGQCNDSEGEAELKLDGSLGGPYIRRTHDKEFLSAPDGAQVITAFTTLINNELLFNPTLSSASDTTSEVRALQAARYLEGLFPQLSFSNALYQPGPEAESLQIQDLLLIHL